MTFYQLGVRSIYRLMLNMKDDTGKKKQDHDKTPDFSLNHKKRFAVPERGWKR